MSAPTHYYFKFDLTDHSIHQWPELSQLTARHGAIRVSVIVESEHQWPQGPNVSDLEVFSAPATEWLTIKVPSIDGTEFWFVSAQSQAALEKKLGFGKTSEPIFRTSNDVLKMASFKEPFSKVEIRFVNHEKSNLRSLSGIQVGGGSTPWPKEKIEAAKDSGDLAFEA